MEYVCVSYVVITAGEGDGVAGDYTVYSGYGSVSKIVGYGV